jgi:DNA-directed RNA polymerase subunit M/transcription elongation factor TFIIS
MRQRRTWQETEAVARDLHACFHPTMKADDTDFSAIQYQPMRQSRSRDQQLLNGSDPLPATIHARDTDSPYNHRNNHDSEDPRMEKPARCCPQCHSDNYLFRGRKKIADDESQAAFETKYRCKACEYEWKETMAIDAIAPKAWATSKFATGLFRFHFCGYINRAAQNHPFETPKHPHMRHLSWAAPSRHNPSG